MEGERARTHADGADPRARRGLAIIRFSAAAAAVRFVLVPWFPVSWLCASTIYL